MVQKSNSRSARLTKTALSRSVWSGCETVDVASKVDISTDADSKPVGLPSVRGNHSTDPLQRRAELIEHYDRHGYPTRARYLERQPEGDQLLRRGRELSGLDTAHQGKAAIAWGRDMLTYWTGWSADSCDEISPLLVTLADFTSRARRVLNPSASWPSAQPDRHRLLSPLRRRASSHDSDRPSVPAQSGARR